MIKFAKVRDVKSPKKSHNFDAGHDFFVPNDFTTILQPGQSVLIPSGIKLEIPEGMVGVFLNKSSTATKSKLIVGAQVIDHGYTGELHINLFSINQRPFEIRPGIKIVQLLLMPIYLGVFVQIEPNYFNKKTDRGSNGFGSTGEK